MWKGEEKEKEKNKNERGKGSEKGSSNEKAAAAATVRGEGTQPLLEERWWVGVCEWLLAGVYVVWLEECFFFFCVKSSQVVIRGVFLHGETEQKSANREGTGDDVQVYRRAERKAWFPFPFDT